MQAASARPQEEAGAGGGGGEGKEAAENMRINSRESSRRPALVINIHPIGNIYQFFIFI